MKKYTVRTDKRIRSPERCVTKTRTLMIWYTISVCKQVVLWTIMFDENDSLLYNKFTYLFLQTIWRPCKRFTVETPHNGPRSVYFSSTSITAIRLVVIWVVTWELPISVSWYTPSSRCGLLSCHLSEVIFFWWIQHMNNTTTEELRIAINEKVRNGTDASWWLFFSLQYGILANWAIRRHYRLHKRPVTNSAVFENGKSEGKCFILKY